MDLLALQLKMDIELHSVATEAKRQKVFPEIRRHVFALLERALWQVIALTCRMTACGSLQSKNTGLIYRIPSLTNMRRRRNDGWPNPGGRTFRDALGR